MDNLSTLDNMSENTHTKLFKLQFSGASGNNIIRLLSGLKSFDFKPLLYLLLTKDILRYMMYYITGGIVWIFS